MSLTGRSIEVTSGRWAPAHDRRALILRRAGRVFLKRGFSETSMSEIAHAVGGSKSTLYSYFNSKDEIFAEFMAAEISRRMAIAFSTEPGGRAQGPSGPRSPRWIGR